MPLTLEDWVNAWDKAPSDIKGSFGDTYEGKKTHPGKALNLLSSYAAYSKSLMTMGWHKSRVGQAFHFFAMRRGDRYTTQVVDAINNFYHVDGSHALNEKYHNVEFILACVKHEMGDTPLNPDDNLAKILEVIRIKTQVDYATLNADIILNKTQFLQRVPTL